MTIVLSITVICIGFFYFVVSIFSPELVTSEFEVNVELYQSQPVENNAKSPSTPVKVFKKLKKVCIVVS